MDIEVVYCFSKPLPDGERHRMKYSQYKKRYADCTTVPGTYDKNLKTIEVIVPEGRMKPSGTRGERFCYFPGVKVKDRRGNVYDIGGIKATNWENACKQIRKMGYEPL